MNRSERAKVVWERLHAEYPGAKCALDHENPFQLLVATILSAQCTDVRVNLVTPKLFARFPDAGALAAGDPEEIEDIIRSTGFYHNKTKSLLGASTRIRDVFGGRVPDTMDDLLSLPGVARKTANVVLGNAFGKNEGVVVDTHVTRLSNRIGFTKHEDPVKIERDLMKCFPRPDWALLSHLLILHGRAVCVARWPRCERCVLGRDACRSYEPNVDKWKRAARTGVNPGPAAPRGRGAASRPAGSAGATKAPRRPRTPRGGGK